MAGTLACILDHEVTLRTKAIGWGQWNRKMNVCVPHDQGSTILVLDCLPLDIFHVAVECKS